jgi:hypothetical protein
MQLAHGDYSKVQLAFLGADLFTGRRVLIDHTVSGLARYLGIDADLVHQALKRESERELIERGYLPLVPPLGPAEKATRRLVRLIREFSHHQVTEMLAGLAPAAIPANDNAVSHGAGADIAAA